MNEEDKKDEKSPKRIAEGVTFITCPRHRRQYPKGGSCPICEAEKRSNK